MFVPILTAGFGKGGVGTNLYNSTGSYGVNQKPKRKNIICFDLIVL